MPPTLGATLLTPPYVVTDDEDASVRNVEEVGAPTTKHARKAASDEPRRWSELPRLDPSPPNETTDVFIKIR